MKPKGWKGESRRHSLARKGIATLDSKKFNVSKFIAEGKASPYFEIDLSKYDVPFVVDLYEDPEYNDRKREITYEVIFMTTDEYIDAIKHGDSRELKVFDFKLDPIKKDMSKGHKFPMPYLEYAWSYGLFYDELKPHFRQEGIHRSIASKELGYEHIPVIVIYPTTIEKFNVVRGRMSNNILNSINMSKVRTEEERQKEYEKKYGEHWYL